MLQTWMRWLGWTIACGNAVAIALSGSAAIAQIVPDETLGSEGSTVTPNAQVRGGQADRIDGGATRGANLFHSFREFNVGEGQRVYFANPTGITNILSRVTGGNVSNILGTLGVDGGANLFLLNPNGIVFGQNARLDVAGSFVGSTADRFTFADGSVFSATNPQASPLLTVSVPIGLQFGSPATGTIANAGNLAAGQDLTLSGNTLDLQGQLQAGGNLTLQAQDTLRIRDSARSPFIAASGGQMLVQGDRSVDIFALSHPNSGFFSGGDLVLRSGDRVGGDAHFWSGGNFTIEQLDGSLGDLYSPNDPIIRSLGDVRFFSYFGNSLHILAAGSVNILVIQIQAPEEKINLNGFIRETIQLSDGSELAIDGSNQPTLDIRAGVAPEQINISNIAGANAESFSFLRLSSTPTSANITVRDIQISNSDGLIILTNQYIPNPSLVGGDITISGSTGIDAQSRGSGGSSVILDSRNNIVLNGNILSSSVFGNGGNITLLARENISMSNGATLLTATSAKGNAGNVTLQAGNSVTLSGRGTSIITNLYEGGVGQGGNIYIRSRAFLMSDNAQLDASTFGQGDAGRISLHADDVVSLEGSGNPAFDTIIFNTVESNAIGNAGGIEIRAGTLSLSNGAQIGADSAGKGNAGDIFIRADNVSLTDTLDNPLVGSVTTGIGSRVLRGGVGTSGDVTIYTGSLSLSGGQIGASTSGTGNGGNVLIHATDSVLLDNYATIASTVGSGGVGNGGTISVDTTALSVAGGSQLLTVVRPADANGLPGGRGNGGDIIVNSSGTINLEGVIGDGSIFPSGISSAVNPGAIGIAGNVRLSARELSLNNAQIRSSSALATGKAGDIDINVGSLSMSSALLTSFTAARGNAGDITVRNADSISLTNSTISTEVFVRTLDNPIPVQGGDINIQTGSLSLTDNAQLTASTSGRGNAGDITVRDADRVSLSNNSAISTAVDSGAIGQGGDIDIQTNSVSLTDNAQISARTEGQGNAGSVTLTANELEATRGGQILTSTSTGSNAGNIRLIDLDRVVLSGTNSGLRANTDRNSIGQAGDININTRQLNIRDNAEVAINSQGVGQAGSLNVTARNVSLDRGRITAETISSQGGDIGLNILDSLQLRNNSEISASTQTGQGGTVNLNRNLNAANTVDLTGNSRLAAQATGTTGNAGSLNLHADRLNLRDSQVTVSSQNTGTAGNLTVAVPDIRLNQSRLTANTESGNGGNVELRNVNTLNLRNSSEISATTQDSKDGSRLRVNANQRPAETIQVNSGSNITTAAIGRGNAGTLNLNTHELTVQGSSQAANPSNNPTRRTADRPRNSSISATSRSGRGGSIRVNADRVTVQDQGRIAASTGTGQAGNLTINANDSVQLNDRGNLSVAARGDRGRAGNLTVTTRQLAVNGNSAIAASNTSSRPARNTSPNGDITLRGLETLQLNNSQISASTQTGQAGSLNIDAAGSVELNDGRLLVQATENNGRAGGLTVTTDRFAANNGSSTSVSSSQGRAGNLTINANAIRLNNSSLTAEANKGRGAEINLQDLDQLYLQNGSQISAQASAQATGGNVAIDATNGFVIARVGANQNNDIIANAREGNGGNIDITTQSILGLDQRALSPSTNDINASSEFGLNGNIAINQLNVDPARGLVELPTTPIDATNQIASACPTNTQEADRLGSFIVSGRGGLPPNPIDLLSDDNVLTDWVSADPTTASTEVPQPAASEGAIVEAQGWVVNPQGKVVLVAQSAARSAPSTGTLPAQCK